ncbi:MAG: phenylphosphate carboxylase subunit delta [Zetaproteobacteria bacterium CG_4_9_14_3_um_filter_49_83]|nr:MAG: phenylphosphate carboxylase subunit delta [Zetaproteobacteria bacterium CG1_02_49_23]PIQ30073.1 MAG: phenylphosphate carboxylase subunit delta [Zetaproteobacteria bacterium CG17_big_fil_post_rev_8_21_14_2_50_50_13]PIV29185.1 MAG: phenylphosphate carboxylase subunit delta [Zetaproteobacteria bacterium CG02_land_8_20_14_3_00_50_9]PIY55979.1 MAG: phenylphosphate carboxylase subunit delta [Zetaproteobacteria bacterium CG_4_10_14_0_8_um_filter_49_80]PJA36345.1 MAG: phenylphosphate carboxylas
MNAYQRFPFSKAAHIRMLVLDVDGVLTAGQIFLHDSGEQMKAFHVRDGHGIKLLQRAGIEVAIITGRTSGVVEVRARELGIRHVIQGSLNKGESIQVLCHDAGMTLSGCAFMGDDVVDLPAMAHCGYTMAPANAHRGVLQTVDWVSDYAGGEGAVRQACEGLILAAGTWQQVMRKPYGVSPEQCGWPQYDA